MYSYGKTPFHVRRSSALSLQNSKRTIFNLSLSRYDANLSRLAFRNLKESMNLNFTSFFWKFFSFLSLMLSICLVNEIYFSFVIGSTSTCPSYAVAISLIIKWASYPTNCEIRLEYRTNFYNLSYNLNALDRGIYRWDDNDSRIVRCERFLAGVTTRRATVCLPLLFKQRFHEYVGGYDIFHAMCQIVELLHESRYTAFTRWK